VHLLKVGSKRRRSKKEMSASQDKEESKDDKTEHLKFQYELLQEELAKTKAEAENNKAATQILTQMIESGEAVQESDGRVSVNKQKPKSQKNNRDLEMK
jgi:hypothetical protein